MSSERSAKALDGRRKIALLCEERAQVVVGFGQIRLQRKRAFECRPRAGCLTTLREQRAETVQRRRRRVCLRGAFERLDRSSLEPLIEQLASVGQIVPERRR